MRRYFYASALLFGLVLGIAAPNTHNKFPACFGHQGVQLNSNRAYECLAQPSGDGGGLYWAVNENSISWDKHPGSGLLWVEAETQLPSTITNPPNPYYYFRAVIAGPFGGCVVINAGYDEHPVQCAEDGGTGPVQDMTQVQQDSYNQFAAAMTVSVPSWAWRLNQ